MKQSKTLLYMYYAIGIAIWAWLLNSSTLGFDFRRQVISSSALLTYLATLFELFLIACYYAWFICYKKAFGTSFTQKPTPYGQFLIILLSLLPVVATHLVIANILLMQRNSIHLTLNAYLVRDFAVFMVPLAVYATFILRHPKYRLFRLHHLRDLRIAKQRLDDRVMVTKEYTLLPRTASKDEHIYLLIWHMTYNISSLRKYIYTTCPLTERPAATHLFFYEVLYIQKIEDQYLVVMTNDEQHNLSQRGLERLLDNPWLISTQKGIWVNMLHIEPKLAQYNDFSEQRWLHLDDDLWKKWNRAEATKPLISCLESSRKHRIKFLAFWNTENLRKMDEKRLCEQYDRSLLFC